MEQLGRALAGFRSNTVESLFTLPESHRLIRTHASQPKHQTDRGGFSASVAVTSHDWSSESDAQTLSRVQSGSNPLPWLADAWGAVLFARIGGLDAHHGMGGTRVWFRAFPKRIPPLQWAAALPDNDRPAEPLEMNPASITALMTMNLLAAGQPLSTEVLTSNQPACVARDAQLSDWKREGLEPFGAQAGGWCVAAILRPNVYEAVQWRHASKGSEGYRIRLALDHHPRADRSGAWEVGLGIHGASMTVTPITAHVPLVEDHRRHI